MLRTRNLTLSGTAQELTINDVINTANTISVQNTHGSEMLYLGTASVSDSSYGIRLLPGATWSADLGSSDEIFATGLGTVAVMILEK